MVDFVRSLSITISTSLFRMVPALYSLFYGLAALPSLFETEQIKEITNNIYTITSIVMLFAFATKAISGIVNPDNLWDSKKGVTGVLKRSLIALALIVGIPFAFEYYYEFQTKVISSALIEKFVLGLDFSTDKILSDSEEEELTEIINKETDPTKRKELEEAAKNSMLGYKIGQSLAQNAFKNVVRPTGGDECTDKSGVQSVLEYGVKTAVYLIPGYGTSKLIADMFTSGASQMASGAVITPIGMFSKNGYITPCEAYKEAVTTNIDYSQYLNGVINTTKSFDFLEATTGQSSGQISALREHYIFEMDFWGLLAVIVSGVIVYMLVLFCIDSAVRLIKMAFLEITAPVSIMAYIAGGSEMLKKWWKEVLGTVISFFLRVAAISFMALVLLNLKKFTENIPAYYGNYARIFIIIGTLIFAKKVPEVIEKLIGVKLNLQGGIGGRLGQMAGVGKVAQNAWNSLGKAAKSTATLPLLGAGAALGFGAKYGAKQFDENILKGRGSELIDKFKDSKLSAGTKAIKSLYSSGGGMKGIKAAKDTYEKDPVVANAKYVKEAERAKKKAEAIKEKISTGGHNITSPHGHNLYEQDSDGNYVVNDAAVRDMDDTQFKSAMGNMLKTVEGNVSPFQLERLEDAQKKNLAYEDAKDKSERLNSTLSYLRSLKTATTNQVAKQKIETLINQLDSGHAGTTNDVKTKLEEIQRLATVSTFTNDALNNIKNNINSGTVNGYNSAITELQTQLGNITDTARQGQITAAITELTNARNQARNVAINSSLDSALSRVKTNLNLNTDVGFDAAISDLQTQLSTVTDASVRTQLQSWISAIEQRKANPILGPNGSPLPINASVISEINAVQTSAQSIVSAGVTAPDAAIIGNIDTVQTAEAIAHSVILSDTIDSQITNLKVVADSSGNLADQSTISLQQKEFDAKEKSDAADKKVEEAIEKANSEQKDYIKEYRKQQKQLYKSRMRNRH